MSRFAHTHPRSQNGRFRPRVVQLSLLLSLGLLIYPFFCFAAESSSTLIVGEAEVFLYARQDDRSERIARLEKGEELTPLAHVVGTVSWYMVRTQKGVIGWVKASDMAAGDQTENIFKESVSREASTWTAVARSGRAFGGTWTIEPNPSSESVSGTWTLRDGAGDVTLRGTWSASKFSTGWNGTWHAFAASPGGEYSGTWSAGLPLASDAGLAALFEAAIRQVVRGIWVTGRSSGSWSIRAVK